MSQGSDQFSAFRHSSYSRYFMARFLTAFSYHAIATAIGWHIWVETENPFWLGCIGLVQFVPALLLVIVTGVATDRYNRRMIMAFAIIAMAVCSLTIMAMAASGPFNPVWVMVVLAAFGIARAFHSPASQSLVVNLVPQSEFQNAVGWVTSSWQLASIFGPVAGGFLAAYSRTAPYLCAVLLLITAATLILSIAKPNQIISKEKVDINVLLGGFRYIWKTKIILGAITLDLFAVMLGGVVALLPIFAKDILGMGPSGLGWLRAAPGIGAIAIVLWMTRYPIKDHAGIILLCVTALFGAATIMFGISTSIWLSLLALFLVGAFDMVSVIIREVLLQLWTPDEVRGRVNAVNSIFLMASNELGEARAGFFAAKWGAITTVIGGGIAAIGVTALSGILFPSLRKIRQLDKGS